MGMLNCGVINLITCLIYFMYFEVEPQKRRKKKWVEAEEENKSFFSQVTMERFSFPVLFHHLHEALSAVIKIYLLPVHLQIISIYHDTHSARLTRY